MSIFESRCRISVRAYPNASRNEVVGFTEGVLHVRVAAPPVKGKANKELIAFLSDVLSVSKSQISILKGETSKNKLLLVEGLSEEEVRKRLQPEAEC